MKNIKETKKVESGKTVKSNESKVNDGNNQPNLSEAMKPNQEGLKAYFEKDPVLV